MNPKSPPAPSAAGLDITLRTGVGEGRTHLSAFDHALLRAGVGNYNLITLSSVIPPASRLHHVDDGAVDPVEGRHGDRLFCVLAAAYADQPGDTGWAGLGWAVDDETGAGLFVEHTATSEKALQELIRSSLEDLVAHRGGGFERLEMLTVSATCTELPACALAVAAYETVPWSVG
ncbi:pyruvoyl-dependent arginine decarboxylase [Nocardioides pantholopis]|uniref:pyruvoyl-dependent arginine decarboxylase n=1 Tax=Nocardioides pantholopis TaxID=2483798 RepID=UPI0019D1C7E4|nr:pyruvoyl-dependent arginine decarboxylase [Nocardioides pantholopis]